MSGVCIMKNNIIAETSYFTDRELYIFYEWAQKEIKSRNRTGNMAWKAEAYDMTGKLLRALDAREKANISYKDHNS